jgi:hypothetical protein
MLNFSLYTEGFLNNFDKFHQLNQLKVTNAVNLEGRITGGHAGCIRFETLTGNCNGSIILITPLQYRR